MKLFQSARSEAAYSELAALAMTARNESESEITGTPMERMNAKMVVISEWYRNRCLAMETAMRMDREERLLAANIAMTYNEIESRKDGDR